MVCVHISKYGNIGNHEGKIPVKSAKNQKKMRDEVGGLMYTVTAHIVGHCNFSVVLLNE
jgi:hypothetical protein